MWTGPGDRASRARGVSLLPVLLMACHLAVVWLQPGLPLGDADTGWHLATGRLMWAEGRIPDEDPFSHTRAGAPWLPHEWLFQLCAAGLEKIGGLRLVVAACALLLACVPMLTAWQLEHRGVDRRLAFASGFLLYVSMLMHAYARPHIVTYLFFAILWWLLEDLPRAGRPAILVAGAGALSALWANLHGGFVAGWLLVGVFGSGALFEGWRGGPRPGRWREAGWYAAAGLACAAGTLLNPHGLGLHRMVFHILLDLELTRYCQEFVSPNFKSGIASLRAFEIMLLALLGLGAARGPRMRFRDWLAISVFLVIALGTVRHVILWMLVAAPIAARAWHDVLVGDGASGERAVAGGARALGCASGLAVAWLAAVMAFGSHFPRTVVGRRISEATVRVLEGRAAELMPLFNQDDFGGDLIGAVWPKVRVFVDGRADFYGDEFMIGEYLPAINAGPGFERVLDKYGVRGVLLAPARPLGAALEATGRWSLIHRDAKNEIWVRGRAP